MLLAILLLAGFGLTACSSDDSGSGAFYPFVNKTYVYQWTLQNTSMDFQYVLHFTSDSTFTLSPIKVETGESRRDEPAQGKYEVNEDGLLMFSGVNSYYTNIKGQRLTLFKGEFSEDMKVLKVYRLLLFNSGKTRYSWIDFNLQ